MGKEVHRCRSSEASLQISASGPIRLLSAPSLVSLCDVNQRIVKPVFRLLPHSEASLQITASGPIRLLSVPSLVSLCDVNQRVVKVILSQATPGWRREGDLTIESRKD
ncbi:hypothetical protein RRG08_032486 [Elysia crispata]|uniref:Uncharacterized protein n=1 Tax=Elysia crispata TaxID=231223 RepID=A0AAE0ZYL0_9GAST|nr:hypothetical protein RRG08_032486 [Elysia crispata]